MPHPHHLTHLYTHCPMLLRQMQEDGREGTFDWDWPIHAWESLHYVSRLVGRPVRREENVIEVLNEIERRLAQEALTV